ncbi:MAG: ATP-binding cassette domain-containing protein [Myxococcales bacterium]|nr:MAG: ATP-binding cassette domain-containing protein [Myxococcales bacterium]
MKPDASRIHAKRLLAYLRPYFWPHFALALVCMVGYSATAGAVPYVVRSLVDDVLSAGDRKTLGMMPAIILGVFGVRGILSFGHTYLSEYVGQHVVYDVRRALSDRVQHLPVAFFDSVATGSILSRVTTDVLLLRQALIEGAAVMIRDVTSVFVLLVVTFYLDWVLATVTFVVFPAVVLPLQALSRRMRQLSHRGLDTLGDLSALLQEAIVGNRVVKAFGMQDYENARFDEESRRLLSLNIRAARLHAFTSPMTEVLAAAGVAAVLAWGGMSVSSGERTAGGFIAFLSALVLLYEPFKKIVRTNSLIQTGLGAAARMFELLDEPGEECVDTGKREFSGVRNDIRFEKVSFGHRSNDVLREIDLTIRAGSVVALVGASGAGKSTIVDLLTRFYDVGAGRITIDGIDVREFSLASLRARIGVVTQFTFLFNDTIRSNIAYGHASASPESIERAAQAANAHEFIARLPQGYDTVVGELGVQLSGGERQRIAIARALLKDAPILILDEATSALDSESERAVQGAIDRLKRGRTVVVVAHRYSTVREADTIAVVGDGGIVERGSHADLMREGGAYKRLYDMQFAAEDPVRVATKTSL